MMVVVKYDDNLLLSCRPDSALVAADTPFIQTAGQVTHMEPDRHVGQGFLLYSEAKFLKTTNGSSSMIVVGSSDPSAITQEFG